MARRPAQIGGPISPQQSSEGEGALPAPAPLRVRLLRPHGFIDEFGQNRHWDQGEIVGDPAQVALLTERGADLLPLVED